MKNVFIVLSVFFCWSSYSFVMPVYHGIAVSSLTISYNWGKVLRCKVKIKDFVVYPKNITKVRCKRVKVIG